MSHSKTRCLNNYIKKKKELTEEEKLEIKKKKLEKITNQYKHEIRLFLSKKNIEYKEIPSKTSSSFYFAITIPGSFQKPLIRIADHPGNSNLRFAIEFRTDMTGKHSNHSHFTKRVQAGLENMWKDLQFKRTQFELNYLATEEDIEKEKD